MSILASGANSQVGVVIDAVFNNTKSRLSFDGISFRVA